MKRFIVLITLLLSVVSQAEKRENAEIFDDANRLYDEANEKALVNPSEAQDLYQKSILKYQFLIEERGLHTEGLHTNLGNAYFTSGDHGRAVLHYQRALDVDPLDEDVLHSLHYVRSVTIDELPETRGQMVRKALTFWHRWPFSLRVTVFGVAHFALWALIATLFYRKGKLIYWSMVAAAALSIVFGLSILTSHYRWDNTVDGVVIEREIIARQGNGYIYDNAFTSQLHGGTEFSIMEQRGEWYKAKLLNGDACWLPANSVELIRAD